MTATALAPTMFLQVGRKRYQVESFKQASEMFCAVRDKAGEGSSRTPTTLIVDEQGRVVGHVTYNGRVWAGLPTEWQVGTRPIYDNRTV